MMRWPSSAAEWFALFLVAASTAVGDEGARGQGDRAAPFVRILSPAHGSAFSDALVQVHAEVSGFDMSLETGCAIVYLNTQRRHKACSARIVVDLADVRDGLSVVDVVLVDERDLELPIMATSSFTVDPSRAHSSPTPATANDPRATASTLIDAIYGPATSRPGPSVEPARQPARPLRLLLSFATDHMRDSMRRLADSALSTGGLDGTLLYGPEHIDRDFVARTAAVLAQRKGAGLWLWKPWLINHTLHTRPDGDLLMYADASVYFVASSAPLFALLAVDEIVCFGMAPHSERKYIICITRVCARDCP